MKKSISAMLISFWLLVGCGADDATRRNELVPLTAITIMTQQAQMAAGTTNQFTAIGDFSGAFTGDITDEVTWAYDGTVLAPVDGGAPNIAQALSAGSGSVSASLEGITDTLDFAVPETTTDAVAVTPNSVTVPLGRSQQFTATGTFTETGGGATFTQDITSAPQIAWSSSAPAFVTIDAAGLADSVDIGPAEITATFAGTPSAAVPFTVTEPVLETVEISPATVTLIPGETQQFTATARMSDGTESTSAPVFTWNSSNTSVATITTAGLATAANTGSSTIRATTGGITGTANLTVGTLQNIAITPGTNTVTVDGVLQLTATGTYSGGVTRDITTLVTWSPSSGTIATVDTSGMVTGIGAGTVTVTASKGTISQTKTITVIP